MTKTQDRSDLNFYLSLPTQQLVPHPPGGHQAELGQPAGGRPARRQGAEPARAGARPARTQQTLRDQEGVQLDALKKMNKEHC